MDRIAIPGGYVDLTLRQVRVDGRSERLAQLEVALLRYLAARPGQPVGANELLRNVWGYREGVESNAVPLAVRRLRVKVEREPSAPAFLRSVPGAGYLLVPDAGAPDPSFVGRAAELARIAAAL